MGERVGIRVMSDGANVGRLITSSCSAYAVEEVVMDGKL